MNSEKKSVFDLVSKLHPEYNEYIIGAAANRISNFLDDLESIYLDAVSFIEDPHSDVYGILLEFLDEDGKTWSPCEMNDGNILYNHFSFNDYSESKVNVGLYANWGGCWGDEAGDDWAFRLGVWKDQPTEVGEVIIGNCEERIRHESYCDFPEGCNDGRYRMRRVILGPFSENAKRWMYEHIDIRTIGLGEV